MCGIRASHCCGLSRCGAQAPDAQAQRPWLTGPAAPRHVGSSRTGARTRVPCIGKRTFNHCATREALICFLFSNFSCLCTRKLLIIISYPSNRTIPLLFIFFPLILLDCPARLLSANSDDVESFLPFKPDCTLASLPCILQSRQTRTFQTWFVSHHSSR